MFIASTILHRRVNNYYAQLTRRHSTVGSWYPSSPTQHLQLKIGTSELATPPPSGHETRCRGVVACSMAQERELREISESEESQSFDESYSSSDDDDEEEPVLKYKRFAKEVVQSTCDGSEGARDVINCITVHPKFIAIGTFKGNVKLLDHNGTFLKDREYRLHTQVINQIAVDEEGEFLATASDDGKVHIIGLFVKYNLTVAYDTPARSVAIHPHFSRSTNRVFVLGNDKLIMIEERRWPLGNKVSELHDGVERGFISCIKWKDTLVAWCNSESQVVRVYDTVAKEKISSITFDDDGLKYPTCLYWQSSTTLLVGKGHFVKTATVKEVDRNFQTLSQYSGDVDPNRKRKIMAIVGQNIFANSIVCGVVPIFNESDWKLVVLGYPFDVDQDRQVANGTVPPPHMIVVPLARYDQSLKRFENPATRSKDKLLPKGHQFCRAEEYHLECVGGEDRFYILTPIDIILAEKRGALDHIEWLLNKSCYTEAMCFAENPVVSKNLPSGVLQDIGIRFIYHLIKCGKFAEAAKKCGETLKEKDKNRWEDFIVYFLDHGQLQAILPYIPQKVPQLSPAVYELVLNTFLQDDSKTLLKTVRAWPTSLYNPQAVINAVEDKLKEQPENEDLLKVEALLHEDLGQYEDALKIYLQQGHFEVFELIQKRKLYPALVGNLITLMKLGNTETVDLLITHRNEPPLQVERVVKVLDSATTAEYLHKYLDGLFQKDPKAGGLYHQRQVELYAKYDQEKLLPFLRSCTDIPLQKALQVCEAHKRYEEMVFLLARMGNPKAALELVIKKLQDVDKAIEFAMEEGDDDLWDSLIHLSISNPKFVTGLLNNVGTHIDPTKLIQKIPEHTEIPNLGASLVKLLQDFQVQVNLRDGCRKILVKDSHSLMEKLYKMQGSAVYIDGDSICKACGNEVIGTAEKADFVLFFCGHVYHGRCVNKRNQMMTCRMCYVHTKSEHRGRKEYHLQKHL